SGVHFLDFCEDFRTCPFVVVVFASDLKRIGDVRQLAGDEMEIQGEIGSYDGRAQIVLERLSQLGREAARLPPLPKEYDVERKGRASAGSIRRPAKTSNKAKRPKAPSILVFDPGQEDATQGNQ